MYLFESYKNLEPKQICQGDKNEKKQNKKKTTECSSDILKSFQFVFSLRKFYLTLMLLVFIICFYCDFFPNFQILLKREWLEKGAKFFFFLILKYLLFNVKIST